MCCRAYGIPSYHVQQLFAQHQGNWTVVTTVTARQPLPLVAASATCTTSACGRIAIKVLRHGSCHGTLQLI